MMTLFARLNSESVQKGTISLGTFYLGTWVPFVAFDPRNLV